MRAIGAGAAAAIASGIFDKRDAIAIAMPDGTVGFWGDAYDVTFAGVTYYGLGGALTVSPWGSAADLASRVIDVTLSGLDSRIAALVEQEAWHQRPVMIYEAVIPAGDAGTVYFDLWFSGFLDQLNRLERPGGTSTITAKCESIAREFGRRGARTRSDADQRQINAADGFYKNAAIAGNTSINWGVRTVAPQQQRSKFLGIF